MSYSTWYSNLYRSDWLIARPLQVAFSIARKNSLQPSPAGDLVQKGCGRNRRAASSSCDSVGIGA